MTDRRKKERSFKERRKRSRKSNDNFYVAPDGTVQDNRRASSIHKNDLALGVITPIKPAENSVKAPQKNSETRVDVGAHYRKEFRGHSLDVGRICQIYGVSSMMLQFAIKKTLACGNRGHKSKRQDILDSINALERELQMMDEDEAYNSEQNNLVAS